jgi:hypothetical protein
MEAFGSGFSNHPLLWWLGQKNSPSLNNTLMFAWTPLTLMAWLEKQPLLKQHTNVCLNTPYFDNLVRKTNLS